MIASKLTRVLFAFVFLAPLSLSVGCENEIAEVETPDGEVELNEEMDGDLDVDVDD